MEYLNSIRIDRYRGIKNLEIDPFSRINFIVGPNGCGKTALTEAIEILMCPQDFSHYVRVAKQNPGGFFLSFHRNQPRPYTGIFGTILQKPSRVEITSYEPCDFKTFRGFHYHSILSEQTKKPSFVEISSSPEDISNQEIQPPLLPYRKLNVNDREVNLSIIANDETVKDAVLSYLSLFDEGYLDITRSKDFSKFVLLHETFGEVDPRFLSDGMQKFIKIAEVCSGFYNGIIILDGMDLLAKNCFEELVSLLYRLSTERELQLFLTFHQPELLDAWLDIAAFYDTLSDLTLFRLKDESKHTSVTTFPGKLAYELRIEQNADLFQEQLK